MTNRQFGSKSEDNKLENARLSISLFWELFDLLGYWAQCQIIAYKRSAVAIPSLYIVAMIQENEGLTTDSHALEEVGDSFLQAMANNFSDPALNYFASEASHMSHQGRYSQLLRLFYSKCSRPNRLESHPWRFAFQRVLRAMNHGQTEELLKPMPVRKNRGSIRT